MIRLEVFVLAALDLGGVGFAAGFVEPFAVEGIQRGTAPVVACPGYSDAPDGSRFTSTTVRDNAVRMVVAPISCAKS